GLPIIAGMELVSTRSRGSTPNNGWRQAPPRRYWLTTAPMSSLARGFVSGIAEIARGPVGARDGAVATLQLAGGAQAHPALVGVVLLVDQLSQHRTVPGLELAAIGLALQIEHLAG